MTSAAELTAIEDWFLARGIPHFIADYSVRRDVFTRAVPSLTLVFLFELAGALNLRWGVVGNAAAAIGGVAILIGAWAAANRMRGRRALARPDQVGTVELAVFLLVPALLPLVFGGQLRSAAATFASNIGLLAAIFVVTSYGLVPMTRWAAGRMVEQLSAVLGLVTRALPMLLLFITFLFINAEVWQLASGLKGPYLGLVAGFFFVVGAAFLIARIPHEVRTLTTFDSVMTVDELVEGTPAGPLINADSELPPSPPLRRHEWWNLGLVVLFTQGVQITLVALVVGLFFIGFGMLAVPVSAILTWTASDTVSAIAATELWGREVVLTQELLRVSAFLAAFTGMYFTVYVITDDTYRREFFSEFAEELRQSIAVRAVYRAALETPS